METEEEELEAELERVRRTGEIERAALERENQELRGIAAASIGELQTLGEQLLRVLADHQSLLQMLEQVRAARELAEKELAAARRDAELYAAEAASLRARLGASEQPAAGPSPALELARLEARGESEPAGRPNAAALEAQLAALRAVTAPDGAIVTVIEGTAFQFNSEQFTDAANGSLLRVARLIELAGPKRVRFVGHTDAQGEEAANRRLSQRRAQAVRDWLVRNRGLDPGKTVVEGRGKDQPIASNDTPEGRRANRRVEVILER
ncbi:MAG: OmpA family protein [Geminicoccaceae bacterium]|nr:OmpA family protein [Geminicoccaceae bacterium]